MSDDNPQWGAVPSLSDGEDVRAETFNRPITELAARTEYLWRMIKGNDRTKVVVQGVVLAGGAQVGQPVYRDSNGAFAPAQGLAEEYSWFYASQKAMVVGVVAGIDSPAATPTPTTTTGDVVLYGHVTFEGGIQAASLISDEGSPVSGRYYLSAQKGMLTSDPNGPVIYVCDCQIVDGVIRSMLVNPQYRDTGESHIHRAFLLDALPVGKYVKKGGASYEVYGIFPNDSDFTEGWPAKLHIVPYGSWHGSDPVNYTFEFKPKSGKTGSHSWDDYEVTWTSDSAEGAEINRSGSFDVSRLTVENTNTLLETVGDFGLMVRVFRRSGLDTLDPAGLADDTWTVSMPDDGRAWIPVSGGYELNLGMYPAMARFVPPNPANGAALIVDGLELNGPVFPGPPNDTRRRWEVRVVDDNGGPWLHWYGNAVAADGVSVTTPFKWTADYQSAEARDIVFHVNRMRVGPTGFVTSLQPAPGSPLVITSVHTDTPEMRGALQIGMDINFKSANGGAAGHQVVKRIEGTTFVTGPVVERVVAGPGLSVNREQGVVRVSVSNAVYAGDFETIALRNAKQDLAGGVFPYIKLLGWAAGGSNVDSGFTAKFRVPDHIPYSENGYY
ncbi:MAG: hypothetical protein IIZ06_08535, partial [Kiritimatiellae bacterium]|nr:hypothetical protein [Kiritimatiellia bacterium]